MQRGGDFLQMLTLSDLQFLHDAYIIDCWSKDKDMYKFIVCLLDYF